MAESSTLAMDRRHCRRYDINLSMQYVLRNAHEPRLGHTINISSSGMLFWAGTTLTVGEYVATALSWPVSSPEGTPLSLRISGHVVWSKGHRSAMAVSRYDFVPESAASRDQATSSVVLSSTTRRVRRSDRRPRTGPVILVVETAEVYRILSAILGRYGFPVWHVTAKQARETLALGRPRIRLLITDTLEEFTDSDRTVPVMYTGSQDPENLALLGSLPLQPVLLLEKPLIYGAVRAAIDQLWRPQQKTRTAGS
jgi:PilZ domain-containing protein